jgi:transketolase
MTALADVAESDKRIHLLTADMGHNVVESFHDRHLDRFHNVGIREQAMVGIAAGMAKEGLRPFCYSIANFLVYRALEFIMVDVVQARVPVVLVGVGHYGSYEHQGATHYVDNQAIVGCLSGIGLHRSIILPRDSGATRNTIQPLIESDGPVYLGMA